MGFRRLAFAPLYRIADWVDDNPVSAAGVIVALGALAAFVVPAVLGTGTETAGLAIDAGTAGLLAETARERPAYPAVAALGVLVVLFYNG